MFLYHGNEDPVLQLDAARATYEYLHKNVYQDNSNYHFTVEDGIKHVMTEIEWKGIKTWF